MSICTLSDTLEIIPRAVATNIIGISIDTIKFPIKVITNSIIGCIKFAETIFPVVNISVISIGIRLFIKPTKLCIESFIIDKISLKFVIIKVTINIYCM